MFYSGTNNRLPNRLQQVVQPVIDDKVCGSSKIWGSNFDPASMICAGPLSGNTNICQVEIYNEIFN